MFVCHLAYEFFPDFFFAKVQAAQNAPVIARSVAMPVDSIRYIQTRIIPKAQTKTTQNHAIERIFLMQTKNRMTNNSAMRISIALYFPKFSFRPLKSMLSANLVASFSPKPVALTCAMMLLATSILNSTRLPSTFLVES